MQLRGAWRWGFVWFVTVALQPPAHAQAPPWPSLSDVARAMAPLPEGATVVVFDPAGANAVYLARRLNVDPSALAPRLGNAAAYREAIPSFVRAEVMPRRQTQTTQNSLVAWELEIPLWNLEGQLWFKPFDQALQIRLVSGAFAPGQFLWQWQRLGAKADTPQSLLVLRGTANTKGANWATRKIAGRSPLAEPAMTVAAAYTLMEGMVDRLTEKKQSPHPQRWPQAPMTPPSVNELETQLAQVAQNLNVSGPLGLVLRHPNGRLDHVQIAVSTSLGASDAIQALAQPQMWRALPGWKRILASSVVPAQSALRSAEAQTGTGAPYAQRWQVDASFPFLDFDATWNVVVSSNLRATAVAGPGRNAVWAWHAVPGRDPSARATWLVFSLYPRLDKLGFLPRKFIEKEPLLEGGLALALAYVNAVTLVGRLPAAPP